MGKLTFDINKYKLKHIISVKDGKLNYNSVLISIDGEIYSFRIEEVKSEIIELVSYFKYGEIKLASGPLEKTLKGYTFGKTRGELSDYEVYNIRFSKFKIEHDGKQYELEITGVGPKAVKVSLFLRYDIIENEDTYLEKELKEMILDKYTDIILNNKNYQDKIIEMEEEYNKRKAKQDKIREEVRREQEEKERKRRELEELLNSNKPKNNDRPFKLY